MPRNHESQGGAGSVISQLLNRVKTGQLQLKDIDDFYSRQTQQAAMFGKELAQIDELTGKPNRRAFNEFLRGLDDESWGFIIFDIDHFKNFNDKHGHLTGDLVLKTMSAVVGLETRESDFFGRWGGEEWALVMPGMSDPELLKERAEEIRKIVEKIEVPSGSSNLSITISAGYGVNRGNSIDHDTFFKRVDDAVYKAKESGRNKVVEAKIE